MKYEDVPACALIRAHAQLFEIDASLRTYSYSVKSRMNCMQRGKLFERDNAVDRI
jgi:hypothetical protein